VDGECSEKKWHWLLSGWLEVMSYSERAKEVAMDVDVIDMHGNSAIVVCPACRGPYIVSDFLDKRGLRKCPHCNTANGITYAEARSAMDTQRPRKQRKFKAAPKRAVHSEGSK
jgi:NAD-dependent SIR2 family protein deacetylase